VLRVLRVLLVLGSFLFPQVQIKDNGRASVNGFTR